MRLGTSSVVLGIAVRRRTDLRTQRYLEEATTILAVGAAGNHAGLVIPALAKRGAHVRGMIQRSDQVGQAKSAGSAEIVIGDLRDVASVNLALRGVQAVFYIAPAFLPDEAGVGTQFVDAAVRAGVRRFVFSAVIHPVLTGLANHAAKISVEEALLNSNLEYTFLHPALYFQNYTAVWPEIVKTGVLAEPWSAETRFSRVDYRDVAESAAIALTEDRLLYGTFELCSSGLLNRWDVAALVSRILGREIKVEKRALGALGKIPAPIESMCEHYEHHGILGNPLTLRAILEREPRSLQAYFEELAAEAR